MFDSVGSEAHEAERDEAAGFPWGRGSVILGAALMALYLAQVLLGGTGMRGLALAGATHPLVLPDLALWTLASSTLLHVSWWHAAGNAVFIAILGSRVESRIGLWRMLVVFFCGGLAGSTLSVLLVPDAIGAGASGGGWGLMLAEVLLWAVPSLRRGGAATIRGKDVVWLLGLNLFISTLPGIAFIAHVAGGLGGAVALALTHWGPERRWAGVGVALATLHLGCLALALGLGKPWLPPPPLEPVEVRAVIQGLAEAPVPAHLAVDVDEELATGIGTAWEDVIHLSYATGLRPEDGSDSMDLWLTEFGAREIRATSCDPSGDPSSVRTVTPRPACILKTADTDTADLVGCNRRYGEVELITFIAVLDEAPGSYQEWARQHAGDTRLTPEGIEYALGVASWLAGDGDHQGALATRRALVDAHPDSAAALNGLAWAYATSSMESVRDGESAVTLASRASGLAPDDANIVDTLAAALAEDGSFERAVAVQERAVAMDPGNEIYTSHLVALRRGEPIRE